MFKCYNFVWAICVIYDMKLYVLKTPTTNCRRISTTGFRKTYNLLYTTNPTQQNDLCKFGLMLYTKLTVKQILTQSQDHILSGEVHPTARQSNQHRKASKKKLQDDFNTNIHDLYMSLCSLYHLHSKYHKFIVFSFLQINPKTNISMVQWSYRA